MDDDDSQNKHTGMHAIGSSMQNTLFVTAISVSYYKTFEKARLHIKFDKTLNTMLAHGPQALG